MSNVTVIIPTFNRHKLCQRAVDSVLAQTHECRLIVAEDGDAQPPRMRRDDIWNPTHRADHWYLTCYDMAHRSETEYVVILCDDDWLEPTFVERCLALMADDVGFVFTESNICFPDGRRELHWASVFGCAPHYPSSIVGDLLLRQERIITPSCCLYRRAGVIKNLVVGNVPGMPDHWMPNPSGPDHLLALLHLLQYPRVGWIADPLVNLDAGPQSTTMQHLADKEKAAGLKQNYDNARKFYRILREAL